MEVKRNRYCIKWSEDERGRDKMLSEEEMMYWFGYIVDNNTGKCRADGIAIALSGKDVENGPLSIAMDTDGPEATKEYEEEFLPRCSEEIQDAHRKTTLTHTPSNGKYWLLGISRVDYPDGLSQSAAWCDIRIELANQNHSQINLLGTRHALNEYLPGYSNIRRIESRVAVSKEAISDYLQKLTEFKRETNILTTIGNCIKPYYNTEHRNEIVFSTSGYLWKYGSVPVQLTIRLFKHIMRVTAYPDEDWDKTIDTIRTTYEKEPDSCDVSGSKRMLAAFNSQESVIKEIEQGFKQINTNFFPEVPFDEINDNGHHQKNKVKSKSKTKTKKEPKDESPEEPDRRYEYLQFYIDDERFAEAVTIGKSQRFATVDNDSKQVSLKREIMIDTEWDEQGNVTKQMVYRPAESVSYMNKPYVFESEDEFFKMIEFVRNPQMCTLDGMYWLVKSIWAKYLDVEESHLIVCAADTIFSYFQDIIGLTHYLWFVGDNESGKSVNLMVFHFLGFRNMMSLGISIANIYQFLGSGEEGIGTICEDEANHIDEDKDKMELAKSGYTKGFPVVKISVSNNGERHQRRYNTFCIKLYSAERTPDPVKAKGLLQRIIKLRCVVGNPLHDILEVVNHAGDTEFKELFQELHRVRNMLLCYRLIHRNDKIPNVTVNLKNREKQLFKPVLRLFYGTKALDEIRAAFSKYANERRQAKLSGLHAFLIHLIKDMLVEKGYNDLTVAQSDIFELPTSEIWLKVKTLTDATVLPGHPLTCDTTRFGVISQKQVTGILEDIFKAEVRTSNSTRTVRFTKADLNRVMNAYDIEDVEISVKRYDKDNNDINDSNNNESSTFIRIVPLSTDSGRVSS